MFKNQRTALRATVKLMLLLPFLAASLIPQGMMTDASSGSLTLVICTPEGLKEIAVPSSDSEEKTSTNDCVFSVHVDQTPTSSQPNFDQQASPVSVASSISDSHLTSLLIHLAYGSRAPPTSS
ncbi:DUF2946 family protein [Kiloniella antarctica]|uniref:DUF2946 family protein n=1 Tax=Kiloniella antarctica TaxID=1550907 RepID=A0ABW5BR24_9PROT